jgi:hypothetical protein
MNDGSDMIGHIAVIVQAPYLNADQECLLMVAGNVGTSKCLETRPPVTLKPTEVQER